MEEHCMYHHAYTNTKADPLVSRTTVVAALETDR
jgi:hypothetical protein